jgi:hypothetical protein
MITDKEIEKIFDWADESQIRDEGIEDSKKSYFDKSWRVGIPREKQNLLDMQYLQLGYAENITYLPKELFKLPNLKGLDIEYTSVDVLPEGASRLETLIFMICNNIKYKKLNNIRELALNDNDENGNINKILESFNTDRLEKLELINSPTFPKKILNFLNLKALSFYACGFKSIPKEIANLSNLRTLNFINCESLNSLPNEIKYVEYLTISNLVSTYELRKLDLHSTDINKVSNEFPNLINLEKLNKPITSEEVKIPLNLTEDSTLLEQFREAKGREKIKILKRVKEGSLTFKEKREIQKEIRKLLNFLNPSRKNIDLKFSTKVKGNRKNFKIKNLLLKGVPGTGKSRAIENIIHNKLELKDHKENILRINIHSASSNADLMQGIGISSKDGQIEYKEKQGLILNLIQRATFNPNQPFVLILEEIQENSLNELIGDLIYLIEEDKRAKNIVADDEEYGYQELVEKIVANNPETAYVEIPYLVNDSTEYRKMIMPNNLYIFCTSNYRDDKKVIEDNLLRRFEVLEIYPKADVVHEYCKAFFSQLNEKILDVMSDEIHPDRFLIGHSNWLKVDSKEKFYRAFLKVVVEFKDIKEVEFSDFEEIVEKLPFVDELDLNSYKVLIEDLQNNAGYDFLD